MGLVIIGTGSWGTTLAGLVNAEPPLRMWCESESLVRPTRDQLKQVAGGQRPGVRIEPAFSSPLSAEDIVLLVVPSSQIAGVARQIRDAVEPPYPVIVTASKGLERATFRTMSQVISATLPEATVAVLSGPTIAKEIAAGRPAKAVLGCEDVHVLLHLARVLGSDRFHLDTTRDKVDVELCAAMKGVFAIGAGVIDARKMGCNYLGLMLTFGLREIAEVARFLGISTVHVFGVAGLGDMVATCFSPDSRNFRLGRLLAGGVPLDKALAEVGMVVEGTMTAAAVSEMAALRLRVPLFAAIAGIVEDPSEAALERFEQVLLDYPSNG
jgi:glycerol-3-phosphate dehydrogenase (NAD(P)+)